MLTNFALLKSFCRFLFCFIGEVGHHSIVDKSSAYDAKGPGFKMQWRQDFIYVNCMFCFFGQIQLRLGPTFKKINFDKSV